MSSFTGDFMKPLTIEQIARIKEIGFNFVAEECPQVVFTLNRPMVAEEYAAAIKVMKAERDLCFLRQQDDQLHFIYAETGEPIILEVQ